MNFELHKGLELHSFCVSRKSCIMKLIKPKKSTQNPHEMLQKFWDMRILQVFLAKIYINPRILSVFGTNLKLCISKVRASGAQIREQMSGPEISWYGKSILGCGLWPGLDRGKKGSGLILSNFFGCFFQFFMGKKKNFEFFLHFSVLTEKLHKIKSKFFGNFFYLRKTSFFLGLKMPL